MPVDIKKAKLEWLSGLLISLLIYVLAPPDTDALRMSLCISVYLGLFWLWRWKLRTAQAPATKKPNPFFTGQAVLLFALAGAVYILPIRIQSGFLLAVLHILGSYALHFFMLPKQAQQSQLGSLQGVQLAFFISGFAALIYQVVWQRHLIGFFGANSESVAIIVAVFMAGLGLGSLAADWFLSRLTRKGLIIFCILEGLIGILGLASLPLMDWVGANLNVPQGGALVGLVSAILLPPTMLMGATLPVLVNLLKQHIPSLHQNVGRLYCVNALGSACAAVATALIFFNLFGQTTTVGIATACNFCVAWMIYRGAHSWHTSIPETTKPVLHGAQDDSALRIPLNTKKLRLSWQVIAGLAFLTGLISISQEVLLLKQAGWLTAGRATTFGIGVGLFLFGLAFGSWKQLGAPADRLAEHAGRNWLYATACFVSIPFAAIWLLELSELTILAVYCTLAACGFFGARTLPMVAGMLAPEDHHKLGRIIASNILGSVLGALIVGNWLLDYVALSTAMLWVGLGGLFTMVVLYALAYADRGSFAQTFREERGSTALAAFFVFGSLLAWPLWSQTWLETMLTGSRDARPFVFVGESRSGIVAANQENERIVIYGGGIYDGAINISPLPDKNGIARLYRMLGMHASPKEVLEIGLSSGSWARALSLDPRIEKLTTVEINPAYLRLVAHFPEVAPVLQDQKTKIVIDDGRRWLRAHPDQKFDLVISNTTFHWRAGATLITSQEFMRLVANQLKPSGLFFMNTTGSENIVSTARLVFPHVAKIDNCIVASFSPLDLDENVARTRLATHPFINDQNKLDAVMRTHPKLVLTPPPKTIVITDDKMNEEYGNKP